MKSAIVAMLCLAFAIRTSSQTQEVQKQIQRVPVAITWDYSAQAKTLILHVLNNSGKDITAYNISVRNKYADGTQDPPLSSQMGMEMLGRLIAVQMAKGTPSEEIAERTNGIFAAGTTHDQTFPETKDITDVEAILDVAMYADGSFDEQNEQAFKRMVATRQRELLAMKKANEIIKNALSDQTNDHPAAVALTELTKYAAESMSREHGMDDMDDPEQGQEAYLQGDIQNLRYMQRPQAFGPQEGKTERERLTQYVEEQEKRVELMTPHCHLEIATAQK